MDSDIKCLASDFKTLQVGSDNCWPYWLEGEDLVIGAELDGAEIKQDRFLWLTQDGISCGTNNEGVELTGYADCKVDSSISPVLCGTSKLARLGINSESSSICVPELAWTKR